jgi:hypothetical protein
MILSPNFLWNFIRNSIFSTVNILTIAVLTSIVMNDTSIDSSEGLELAVFLENLKTMPFLKVFEYDSKSSSLQLKEIPVI